MNLPFKRLFALAVLSGSAAFADFTVSFPVMDTVLRNIPDLTLNISVDGSAAVSLDASTTKTVTAVQALVNSWDSSNVGSVSDPVLFNTTCQLIGRPVRSGLVNNFSTAAPMQGIGITNPLIIGGAVEAMELTFLSLGGHNLQLMSFGYAERIAHEDSNFQIIAPDSTTTYLLPLTPDQSGTVAVSDIILEHEELITITNDPTLDANSGSALYSMTFDLVVPEALFTVRGPGRGQTQNLKSYALFTRLPT